MLRQYGVLYDVGRTMSARSMNWRPDYSPALVRRELEIIHTDLAANAVRLCGRDPARLLAATEHALALGLQYGPARSCGTPRPETPWPTSPMSPPPPNRCGDAGPTSSRSTSATS
jgi:hypothetical protein